MNNFISNEAYEEKYVQENLTNEADKTADVISFEDKNAKRPAFAVWKISEDECLKLKLTTSETLELEKKFKKNLISLMGDESNIPPLTTMLQLTHSAALPWIHGIRLKDIESKYETYVKNGGNQMKFYVDVYLQIFMVSGFFSSTMTEEFTAQSERLQDMM